MIKMWNWIKNNPNRAMFLVPIILVAIISISHVVTWYDMANPIKWAIYLNKNDAFYHQIQETRTENTDA